MSPAPSLCALANAVLDLEYQSSGNILERAGLKLADTVLADVEQQSRRRRLFEDELGGAEQHSGGSVANSLTVAALAGVDCTLMSALGADAEGARYRRDMGDAGVRLLAESKSGEQTANCLALITAGGERTLSTHLGCCADMPDILDRDTVAASDWLLLEGYCLASPVTRQTLAQAQEFALKHGTRVALTLSSALLMEGLRPVVREFVERGLELIVGNEAEAQAVSDCAQTRDALAFLSERVPVVAITCASQGALIAADGESWQQMAEAVLVKNGLGAGDAFAGGLIAALAMGRAVRQAAVWGCVAGALQVQNSGPRLNEEGRSRLRQYWAKN